MEHNIHKFALTENIFTLLSDTVCICVFCLHLIILVSWIIQLFNSSIRLRRKLKYLTTTTHSSDTSIDILNSQVEYRKNLFMFVIVLFELISSILIIISSIQDYELSITRYFFLRNKHDETKRMISQNMNNSSQDISISSQKEFSTENEYEMSYLNRLCGDSFRLPLIMTITLVYTLMSYYVMVAKKSLNYLTDLKSVELEREQKAFLVSSSIACVISLLLLVRVEVLVFHYIFEVLIVTVQLFLTRRFRARLICVMKWKILDTRIAFGTNHYQFKSYTGILRKFKLFTLFYISFLLLFYINLIFRTLLLIAETIQLGELNRIYRIEIILNTTENTTLYYITHGVRMIEQVSLSLSFLCLFLLNIFSLPYLLSKINISFHCNCKRFCFKSS